MDISSNLMRRIIFFYRRIADDVNESLIGIEHGNHADTTVVRHNSFLMAPSLYPSFPYPTASTWMVCLGYLIPRVN